MIHTSPHPPLVTGGPATVPGLVREAARRHPERTALVDSPTGGSVTYRELVRRIDLLAGWLAEDGLRRGDRLALWAPNVPPFAAVALAAMEAGAAVTTLNPGATATEVATQVADAGASVLVTVPDLVPAALATGVRRVVSLGEAAAPAVALGDVLASAAASVPPAADPDAVALLPYSSGTTGLPKGVMLTHANLVAATRQLEGAIGACPGDVTIALAPFFHILGFTGELLLPLAVGATVVTVPAFDPAGFAALIERHRATYLAVPPPVAAYLARHPAVAGCDLSSLELLACGGAPLPPAVEAELAVRLPGCTVGQGYGLTETCGAVSVPERGRPSRPGAVGRLLAGTELRVVDLETGGDAGAGASGELWVRGPQVMAGYLGRPEATAEMIDGDGWLRTGDLGRVEPSGEVVIEARLKELIKVNAFQVAPAELEALLVTHPAVADAAVFGRPDERTGEAPVAVLVPRPGADVDPAEVMGWLAERVAPYKRLAEVRVAGSLPRTPSGKLLRRLLAEVPAPA